MKKIYNKLLEKISKNKFRKWKLKQPLWLQLLIEIPIYIFIFWILNYENKYRKTNYFRKY
jgi:hypothetical protein